MKSVQGISLFSLVSQQGSNRPLKAHYHDGVVCSNCMHTACNGMFYLRAAAVRTTSKKQKYVIWNTAFVFQLRNTETKCFLMFTVST